MDRLAAMELFVRVVETGSFSAAAREAGMAQPSVSRQLRALEKRLGARLLNRSTRHSTLTEAGRAYYEGCRRIIAEVSAAEGNLGTLQASLRGTLKVNTSVALGEDYIAPIAYRFQRQHPELAIDLTLNERVVDLVEEGIDLAVRFGPVVDENLVARRLGSTRRLTVATPAYLRKHGAPKAPADLTAHNCIGFNYAPATEWVYAGARGETKVKVSGAFRSNNGHAIRGAIVAGLGIGWLPEALVHEQLKSGALKAVLTDWVMPPLEVHAVYPTARHLPAKVRSFVDRLQQQFQALPMFNGAGSRLRKPLAGAGP